VQLQGNRINLQGQIADFGEARKMNSQNKVVIDFAAGTRGHKAAEVLAVQTGVPTEVG
jgi:hypothetical protein